MIKRKLHFFLKCKFILEVVSKLIPVSATSFSSSTISHSEWLEEEGAWHTLQRCLTVGFRIPCQKMHICCIFPDANPWLNNLEEMTFDMFLFWVLWLYCYNDIFTWVEGNIGFDLKIVRPYLKDTNQTHCIFNEEEIVVPRRARCASMAMSLDQLLDTRRVVSVISPLRSYSRV